MEHPSVKKNFNGLLYSPKNMMSLLKCSIEFYIEIEGESH